jgi:hypothetical protein
MKSIIYPLVMFVFAFANAAEAQTRAEAVNLINGFHLNLERNDEGQCVLSYKRASQPDARAGKIVFEMSAPCEFVRLPWGKVMSYAYGKRGQRYHAVIIVGGKPDAESKDELMPDGCGTEFVAVSVFSSGIKTSDKINSDAAICPAQGLDEKYFNIYAKP